ncbi:MAG TPA: ATP-binding cassette domain-containing protein [Streptosporangiaceae bacterium]|nr:ATP-binding cassette domain-containing protein [Streptosporangiaceae bacterium]
MLAVEGLSAGYDGILALHDVSITVPRATITAVLGANGAGKTTLLRTISGLVQARRGRVSLAGTDLAGRKPAATLSGGERQMLVIGRALMARPRLLLLDEPSLGLAPKVVASLMHLVRKLRDDTGLTVLLVEQNARSALAIADQGVVLNLGRTVAVADAATLAADAALRHHYLGF